MNTKQIILVGVGVAVLCAGIGIAVTSFGTTSTPDPDPNKKDGRLSPADAPLDFPDKEKMHSQEANTPGYHAFRFVSKSDKPTLVGINWKNCKCASVEICIAPDEWKTLDKDELIKKVNDPNLEWTPLAKEGGGFSIPAGANGWVRLGWEGKTGDQRFTAEMWVDEPNSAIILTLDMGVSFIDPVNICWEEEQQKTDAALGKLSPGDQREVQFLIWSTTRDKFTVAEVPRKEDPCVRVSAPTPLSAKELQILSVEPHKRKALSGYRVAVNVWERSGEHQLDIGPLRRGIAWKTDAMAEPVWGSVSGTVLGEVAAFVAGKPDHPRLEMGRIEPEKRIIHVIRLESENPQVELSLDDKSCDLFKVDILEKARGKDVTLNDGSVRRTWTVNVTFRPEAGFRGPFPDKDRPGYTGADCVVAFKITYPDAANQRPRRIKVPVSGEVRN